MKRQNNDNTTTILGLIAASLMALGLLHPAGEANAADGAARRTTREDKMEASTNQRSTIPPLDAAVPKNVATATFALG